MLYDDCVSYLVKTKIHSNW